MQKLITAILLLSIGVITGVSIEHYQTSQGNDAGVTETALMHAKKHLDPNYVCPMHSQIVSGEPGSCPICGMDLVEIKTTESNVDDVNDPYPTVSVPSTMINNMGVRVSQVERKTLVRQIETPGFITAVRKVNFTRYTAPAKGRVVKLHFQSEQWLEQGDPLIDIELDDLVLVQKKHLELLAKENEMKTEQTVNANDISVKDSTTKELSHSDLIVEGTNESLYEHSGEVINDNQTKASVEIVSDEKTVEITTERTRLLMKAAGMTDKQIAELEKTKITSAVITLYAKTAGEVELLRVKDGDEVKANAMLFTFGGLMKVTVLANAFQRDASWVKPGQDVDVILPHDSNKPFKGTVSSGAVSININSQNIGIELVFLAPKELVKTGMYVVGNIYGQVRDDTLTVPREAVIYSRNEKRVIVALGEGRFKPVVVETGISNDTEIEILEGVEEDDTIVVSAQFLIDSESSLQASYRRMTGVDP